MKSYLMLQQPTDDQMMTYAISVATLLATARGKSRPLLFMTIQGENIDMDEALCKIQHSHPHILGFGSDLSNMVEFRVVIEKKNVMRTLIWMKHYARYNIAIPIYLAL
ncbi:PREDICTED: uncharacterized protein LOC109592333, partial [Amphimedon queenslandica]